MNFEYTDWDEPKICTFAAVQDRVFFIKQERSSVNVRWLYGTLCRCVHCSYWLFHRLCSVISLSTFIIDWHNNQFCDTQKDKCVNCDYARRPHGKGVSCTLNRTYDRNLSQTIKIVFFSNTQTIYADICWAADIRRAMYIYIVQLWRYVHACIHWLMVCT